MPNLGAAIWRTILNIKLLCFPRCVPELLLSHLPTFMEFLISPMHSNVTIKNLSWPHFSWATLYIRFILYNPSNGRFINSDDDDEEEEDGKWLCSWLKVVFGSNEFLLGVTNSLLVDG